MPHQNRRPRPQLPTTKLLLTIAVAIATTLPACSALRLDPEQVAARIALRPTWLELTPSDFSGSARLRAKVQACNSNDFNLTLVEAPWQAELLGVNLGQGVVAGPMVLVAGKCSDIPIDGNVVLGSAAMKFAEALMMGKPLEPVVVVDAIVRVYGVPVHRKVRLVGFGLRPGG